MAARTREEKLFGAACLRLTLESIRGRQAPEMDIYRETLQDLGLADEDVERFLEERRVDVEKALSSRGVGQLRKEDS